MSARVPPPDPTRYMLYEEIASGGMASVHLARQHGAAGFSRIVAIKQLHPHLATERDFVAMFLDEARLCARIRHQNVVPTLDVVEDGPLLQLVMEYVHGVSLSELVGRSRAQGVRPPMAEVVTLMVQVLHGLHAAHEATTESGQALSIVHRDVSPQNILVGADGVARVVDFGVAKAANRLQTTRDGQLKGKVAYMSPEQLSGATVDRRTDIFAASVVLWEALTGQRLFRGENPGETLALVLSGPVAAPSRAIDPADSEAWTALDRIVLRGLERNPALRYQSAREMAIELEAAIPLASPSKIGAWVEALASETLVRRAAQVARAEQAVRDVGLEGGEAKSAPGASGTPRDELTDATLTVSPAQAPASAAMERSRGVRLKAALGALGVVVASGSVIAVRGCNSAASVSPTPKVRLAAAHDLPLPGASVVAESAPPVPTVPASTTVPLLPPSSTAARPKATLRRKTSCNPPYVIDAATGHRRLKRECL